LLSFHQEVLSAIYPWGFPPAWFFLFSSHLFSFPVRFSYVDSDIYKNYVQISQLMSSMNRKSSKTKHIRTLWYYVAIMLVNILKATSAYQIKSTRLSAWRRLNDALIGIYISTLKFLRSHKVTINNVTNKYLSAQYFISTLHMIYDNKWYNIILLLRRHDFCNISSLFFTDVNLAFNFIKNKNEYRRSFVLRLYLFVSIIISFILQTVKQKVKNKKWQL